MRKRESPARNAKTRRRPAYRPKPRDEIARNMSAIRSVANKTEVALGHQLHALGFRYRKYGQIQGKPDLVFPTERVAIFIDGDYWHGRLLVEQGRNALKAALLRLNPAAQQYWMTKFTRRIEHDAQVTSVLRAEGWLVIRLWESDVKRDIERTALQVARKVLQRRTRLVNAASRASAPAKKKGL